MGFLTVKREINTSWLKSVFRPHLDHILWLICIVDVGEDGEIGDYRISKQPIVAICVWTATGDSRGLEACGNFPGRVRLQALPAGQTTL